MMTKKVKVYETTVYVWECPSCGHFNEDGEDPDYQEEVTCEDCCKDFIPELQY